MKQFTNAEQTAKLIELGFEKPSNTIYKQVAKRKIGYGIIEWEDAGEEGSYSIGELIEMLDEQGIEIIQITDYWRVGHEHCDKCNDELIDALYEMVVKLKVEGVI